MHKIVIRLGLIVGLVFSFLYSSGYPGERALDCKFYKAYVSGEMSPWAGYIDQLEDIYTNHPSPNLLYDIVKAYYGYIAYAIGIEDDHTARDYLNQGESYLTELTQMNSYLAEAKAFKGAFIAFEIGMNVSKAVFLGPRSMRYINRALELEPDNVHALLEKGNAEYHMPRMFGGSYEKAIHYFQNAVQNLERNAPDLSCNWIYMNALAWLAQSYEKAGGIHRAEKIYKRILTLEPDFNWVAEELYPKFKQKYLQEK